MTEAAPEGQSARPVLIAGGGTAGHAVPALAVAQALVRRGRPVESILFVGSRRGLEARLVPEAGFAITLLPGRGIPRRLGGRAFMSAAALGLATVMALGLMLRRRPLAVLAVGGYASFPCALAAVALRIPLVLEEQNAVPGSVNRLLARFARAAAVAFPGTCLPRAEVTGRPLPPGFEALDRSPEARRRARAQLGVPEEGRLIGVTGGSLGALRINQAVVDLAERWAGPGRTVYHVIGARDFSSLRRPSVASGYFPVEYESRMPVLLSAVDLMIGRAGGWVAELTAAGVPSILVPLPNAPGDHQTANARVLEAAGAAVWLPDDQCSGERLERLLGELLAEPGRLEAMAEASGRLGRPDAAERVAELLEAQAASAQRTKKGTASLPEEDS